MATPSPTATARPPINNHVDQELIDAFRIENAWECGGSAHECMWLESDAFVLARVAIGEAPHSPNDQVFVMWNIKMRAHLGFKEAGFYSGYRDMLGRWGPETTVKEEALCKNGCQYSPARIAANIYYPCNLKAGDPMRMMLCPTDEQLPQVIWAIGAAEEVLAADIREMPSELIGYDSFRSPEVDWYGRRHREGGLVSRQFFARGNIWRDEYPDDNEFFDQLPTPTPTVTATPTATPEPTATRRPVDRNLPTEPVLVYSDAADRELDPQPQTEQEATPMKVRRTNWFTLIVILVITLLSFALMAFQVAPTARLAEIIAGIIAFVALIFGGPKWLTKIYDLLKIPGGAWRVFATYFAAGIVGLIAVLVAGLFFPTAWTIESILALAGVLATAAQMAYHRLKDAGGI